MHKATFYHPVIQPCPCFFDKIMKLSLFFNQQFLSFLEPLNTSFHMLGQFFLEAKANIEVALSEAIKRRIRSLRRIEAHEWAFRHIEQQVRKNLKQSCLLVCWFIDAKTHHQQALLFQMLKVHCLRKLYFLGLRKTETESFGGWLELFGILVELFYKVLRIHVTMKDHCAVGKCYSFLIVLDYIIKAKLGKIQSSAKGLLIKTKKFLIDQRVNSLIQLELSIEELASQIPSKAQSFLLIGKPTDDFIEILSPEKRIEEHRAVDIEEIAEISKYGCVERKHQVIISGLGLCQLAKGTIAGMNRQVSHCILPRTALQKLLKSQIDAFFGWVRSAKDQTKRVVLLRTLKMMQFCSQLMLEVKMSHVEISIVILPNKLEGRKLIPNCICQSWPVFSSPRVAGQLRKRVPPHSQGKARI